MLVVPPNVINSMLVYNRIYRFRDPRLHKIA